MKYALTLVGPRKLTTTNIPGDLYPQKGEVLVEIDRISLCGSDYRLFNGDYAGQYKYPIVLGHEWSGKILEVGSNCSGIKLGDHVTGDCSCWCGYCINCTVDKNLCENIEKFGITIDGFARQIAVVPSKYLYVAPPNIPMDVLALTELFSVALKAIHRLGQPPTEPPRGYTLILGCGPLGMAIYVLLRNLYNWKRIKICDNVPQRLSFLKNVMNEPELIYKTLVDESEKKANNYKKIYAAHEYPIIFEAVGKPYALQIAIRLAAPNSTIICLGMSEPSTIDTLQITAKTLNIHGSIGGTGEFSKVLDFWGKNNNTAVAKSMISGTYSFKEATFAFEIGQRKAQSMKTQIRFKV